VIGHKSVDGHQTRRHVVQPLRVPPPILVGDVVGIGCIGVGVLVAGIGVAKVVPASVVRWVDVNDIDCVGKLGLERDHDLQVVALDDEVAAIPITKGELPDRFENAWSWNRRAIGPSPLPMQVQPRFLPDRLSVPRGSVALRGGSVFARRGQKSSS